MIESARQFGTESNGEQCRGVLCDVQIDLPFKPMEKDRQTGFILIIDSLSHLQMEEYRQSIIHAARLTGSSKVIYTQRRDMALPHTNSAVLRKNAA